jgi:hypothetical protein
LPIRLASLLRRKIADKAQASTTVTAEKLAAKSSTLDFTVIQEREAELKLHNSEEKRKAYNS